MIGVHRDIRNVKVRHVESDEIWAYIGKEEKARASRKDDQNLGRLLTPCRG